MKVLVTGGAGFIGSTFVKHLLFQTQHSIVNVDKLTYAANRDTLKTLENETRHTFYQCDIVDAESLSKVFEIEHPDAVVHLAAESHVDRSIATPAEFIQTNVVGTFNLLNCALKCFESHPEEQKRTFRFVHVSTDEVYGSLSLDDHPTTEAAKYAPSSPYSASKAGSDHLALAWQVTFGLPVIVTHAANNYGPFQYPEKLIPTIISNAVDRKSIPVYGDGTNVRDWLHVADHCQALQAILEKGIVGETYNVGADNERGNLEVVKQVCRVLDELRLDPSADAFRHASLLKFVTDRKGHDFRYALDTNKLRSELNWRPSIDWTAGIRETVQWYLENEAWWRNVSKRADAAKNIASGSE